MERAENGRMVRSRTSCSCPLDVWREILLRLPADNLIELKRVCKPWRELIEDGHFVEAHRNLHGPRTNGVLLQRIVFTAWPWKCCLYYMSTEFNGYNNDLKLRKIPVPDEDWWNWRVCDSYRELLLIRQSCDDRLILYNCITRSIKRLPPHNIRPDRYWDWKMVHDASTNRNTVLGLRTRFPLMGYTGPGVHKCLMLELDEGNQINPTSLWKELPFPRVPNKTSKITRSGARNNGRLYWLILGSVNSLNDMDLLSFDLATGKFEIKACSSSVPAPLRQEKFLFVSNGTFYYTPPRCNKIELWVLKNLDRRPKWVRHHVIKNDPVSCTSSSVMAGNFIPSGLLGTKSIMILKEENKIAAYDMSSEKFSSIVVDDTDEAKEGGYVAFDWGSDGVAQFNSFYFSVACQGKLHPD